MENSIFDGIKSHPYEVVKDENGQYRWKVLNEKNPDNNIGNASEQYKNKAYIRTNALSVALSIINHYESEALKG